MNFSVEKRQRGIGLLEVLIALLVVALGLLGLAKLQGSLMQSSGENKARSEAMALAHQKLETLRQSTELENTGNTGFTDNPDLTAAGNPHTETITGTNATFTVQWNVTDDTAFAGATAPPRKEVDIQVAWTDADGTAQTVLAATELVWMDPSKGLLYASNGDASSAAVPSPRQNASSDVPSESVKDSTVDGSGDSDLDTSNSTLGSTLTLPVIADATDQSINETNVVLTQIAPDSHYYATDNSSLFFVDSGVIAVFVCESGTPVTCRYIQNHFGGVPLRTKGTVYSNTGTLSNIDVAWTSSDVNACYTSSEYSTSFNGQSVQAKDYECVYAGNCEAVAEADKDGIGNFTNGNGCSTNVTTSQIQSRNVGPGGEFGDIGLLGLDSQGGGREMVCFLENTSYYSNTQNVLTYDPSGSASPEDYILPVTKRSYVSRRMNSDGSQSSEGINQSYTNHNFLVIERGNTAGSYQNCYKTLFTNTSGFPGYNYNASTSSIDTTTGIALAMRQVVKVQSGDNTVTAEEAYSGGTGPSQTILQSIASNSTNLRLYISEGGSCYIKSSNSLYACAVPSDTVTATVQAGSSTYPSSSTTYASCTKTVADATSLCEWTTNF